MAYDRQDHAKLVSDRQHERAREIMPLVRLVAGAAPLMEKLTTGDERWDRYLQYLQGILDRFELSRDGAREKLASPSIWNRDEMLKLKSDALIAQATVDALRLAIELPKAIMGGKGEADRIIEDFTKKETEKNESAGQPES